MLPHPAWWRGIAGLGLLLALRVCAVSAHPLGNFAVSRYARLDFSTEQVRITYLLDFAEVPTYQLMAQLDPNGDGELEPDEAAAYLDGAVPRLIVGQQLTVAGQTLPLTVLDRSAVFITGPAGLPTLRIAVRFGADLPADWRQNGRVSYRDDNYRDRIGWREILARGDSGITVDGITGDDLTDELQVYPQDLLDTPLALSDVTFTLLPGGVSATAGRAAGQITARDRAGGGANGRLAALLRLDHPSSPLVLFSLLLAAFWGAAHALSPGHGKTVVAAYLVGTRGTARHAAFLGITVTLTHTLGVFVLGVITLWLARFLLPEQLYPWLNLASSLLVVTIGAGLIVQRLAAVRAQALGRGQPHRHAHGPHGDHCHPRLHAHDHPDGGSWPNGSATDRVTWRGLVALGVSGGLIPCPSALVLFLSAVALGRIGYGLILVLAFSGGLALVLTLIGLLAVYARQLFVRLSFAPRLPALVPLVSALAISLTGALMLLDALRQVGMV